MKKFILTLITVLSLGLCFTSCTKGDEFVDEYIEQVEENKASDEPVDTRNWLYVNTRVIDSNYKPVYLKEGIINNNDGTFSMVKEDFKRDGSRNTKIDVIAIYSLQELKTFLYNDIINADFKGDTKGGIWRVTKLYINKITSVDYYHRFDKCDVNVSFTTHDYNYNHYYTNTETVTFSSNGISFTMNFNTLKDVVNKLYQF